MQESKKYMNMPRLISSNSSILQSTFRFNQKRVSKIYHIAGWVQLAIRRTVPKHAYRPGVAASLDGIRTFSLTLLA
jgi:hypothetical protein